MSKYIAIIDLPDDGKCDKCKLLTSKRHKCKALNEPRWEVCLNDGSSYIMRPTDCPLIPVERVMERPYGLCQSQGDAGYRAVGIVQDELGVTE